MCERIVAILLQEKARERLPGSHLISAGKAFWAEIGNPEVYPETLRSHSGFITVDSDFLNASLAYIGEAVR